MTRRLPAVPPVVARAVGYKQLVSLATGELLTGTTRPRRVVSPNVYDIVQLAYPLAAFRLMLKRNGVLLSAYGPVTAHSLEVCYPGCTTDDDVAEAEDAFRVAGLTKGTTPAGRALHYAERVNPAARQRRVTMPYMAAFQEALYGGYQFGGAAKPGFVTVTHCTCDGDAHQDCTCGGGELEVWDAGMYQADIVSSYPYLATLPLPTVGAATFERGWQRGAVLVRVAHAVQDDAARLFSRTADGMPVHREEVAGWYVADEVDYLHATGRLRQLDVDACVTFRMAAEYLRECVEQLATFKADATSEVRRLAVKSAMNGLVGKYAARLCPWRPAREGENVAEMASLHIGATTLVLDEHLGQCYPRTSNVVWTALTNARARVRLWQKMDEIAAAGGEVLWCHTDAVIARVPDTYEPASGTGLGDWHTITRTYHRDAPPPPLTPDGPMLNRGNTRHVRALLKDTDPDTRIRVRFVAVHRHRRATVRGLVWRIIFTQTAGPVVVDTGRRRYSELEWHITLEYMEGERTVCVPPRHPA